MLGGCMMVSESLWRSFRADCIEAMERFQNNEIKMAEVDGYLQKYEHSDIDAELFQFILNTISEIDADAKGYRETLKLLKDGASAAAMQQYMMR